MLRAASENVGELRLFKHCLPAPPAVSSQLCRASGGGHPARRSRGIAKLKPLSAPLDAHLALGSRWHDATSTACLALRWLRDGLVSSHGPLDARSLPGTAMPSKRLIFQKLLARWSRPCLDRAGAFAPRLDRADSADVLHAAAGWLGSHQADSDSWALDRHPGSVMPVFQRRC